MATRDTDGFTTSDDTQTFTFDTTQGQTTYTSYTTRGEDTTTQYETTTADDNSTLNETKINVQERNQLKWGAAHFNDLTNRQVPKGNETPIKVPVTGSSGLARARGHVKNLFIVQEEKLKASVTNEFMNEHDTVELSSRL